MRGYRRRNPFSYLAGVVASFVLVTQLGSALLSPPDDSPWWGLYVHDGSGTVRRLLDESPAAQAGVHKGDVMLTLGGAPPSRPWERVAEPDGRYRVEVATPGGEPRELFLNSLPYSGSETVRLFLKGIVAGGFALIGLVVFLSRSDRVATLFFLMCLLFARLMLPVPDYASRVMFLVDKLTNDVAYLVLPAVVLHFFLSFPQRARFLVRNGRLAWLLYVPAIVATPIAFAFDLELGSADGAISASAVAFQRLMAMIFVGMIVWGIVSFVHGVRTLTAPVLRRSLKWLLPGIALGILPPLLLSALLNLFPTVEVPGDRYAFVTLVLVPLSFAHGIIRYGLMDLELVAKRSVVYTTLTALLVAIYYFAAEVLGRWFLSVTGPGRSLVSFAVVFAAALLFVPARDRIQAFVDRSFYRRRYDYRHTLQEFSRLFATFLEREELVRLLVDRLPDVIGAGRVALFLRSSPDSTLHLAGTRGIGAQEIPIPVFDPSESLLAWWGEFDGPIPISRAHDRFDRLGPDEAELFGALDPAVVIFLPRERTIEGVLLLGAKESAEPYRSADLELLATLGDQAGTALSSSRLHEEALERRRMEEELAVAKRIQASLLPSSIPTRDGVEIAALTRPCLEVGGDFYDCLDFGEQGVGLAVADVSGKGVPAALILSSLQATLRAEAGPNESPEPVIRKINERLCQDVVPGSFASMLYAHLDIAARSLRYVNAGHPAGLVVHRDGSLDRLETGGILLGVEADADYVAGSHSFETGDLLLLYSDGVTDVLNEADEEYGQARLEGLLPRIAHLPTQSLMENVIASVEAFVGGALPDDLTLLVAKFLPRPTGVEAS